MTKRQLNDLLLKIKQGDKSAFETLYKKFYPKMLYVAKSITNNYEDARDAVQTAFERLWKYVINGHKSDAEYNNSYLYTITKRAALDIAEHRKSCNFQENIETAATDGFCEAKAVIRADIQSVISKLKEPEQTVALQFFLFGMKIKEIAEYLHEPVGTVKWRISEIKKHFKDFLK